MPQFSIDFRNLDLVELKSLGILSQDIIDVFLTENSEIFDFIDFKYVIGYVNQTKFIHVAYTLSKNVNFDIELLQVGLANEEDIRKYWCNRKNKN